MNIGSVCKRRVVTIDARASFVDAARLMREHHVGALVVTAAGPDGMHVKGVVTDRDIVIDALARGPENCAGEIGSLAGKRVIAVRENDDVTVAAAAMRQHGVRRLLVTDTDDNLVGIAALDDLLDGAARQFDTLVGVIRRGVEQEAASARGQQPLGPLRIPSMGTVAWHNPVT
jgi:CBS domain-containing protein